MNSTALSHIDWFNRNMRLINLALSCTGILTNSILLIILLRLHRHQCTTYFLLILMTLCDLLYCTVYTSILLTIDQYLNIINHQILCPLSFFLTPFTFTGSTLLLLICLLHLITNYVRRYDTILGQICGRLSVVFVFAFVIIRSVLGSTSIELISDSTIPSIQHCTIDMNTPDLVTKVQNVNYIFAEVTDILIYIGWPVILSMYFISFISCLKSQNSNSKFRFLTFRRNDEEHQRRLNNKQRHRDVSLIILWITIVSILLYLPLMINKFITMNLIYRIRIFLSEKQIVFLQVTQQTTHLFCLTIRFLPYLMFDCDIRLFFHRMIGMKIQRKQSSQHLQKYICRCQCSRPQQSLEFNSEEQKHAEV